MPTKSQLSPAPLCPTWPRAGRDQRESLRLAVHFVFVEFDLDQVGDAQRLDGLAQVLVGRPPSQITHIAGYPFGVALKHIYLLNNLRQD